MRRSARGFTLMEIMVAVAITALMGSVIAAAFSSGINAKETIEADAEYYRTLRASLGRMSREISAAYVSDRFDLKHYRDQNERPTNFVGEHDRLMFSSLAHARMSADAKESDQMVVEYSVKASPDPLAKGRHDLVRRENAVLGEHMERGGSEESLFENAKGIEFSYWDSDKKQWVDEWDTRRLERKSWLPTRVRIVLIAKDENNKEVRYQTQARIMLNAEFPEVLMRRFSEKAQRGVALLMVIVAIAILGALAAEFAYNSRVDLQMATNQRDDLRAYYLAKSGLGVSRMILRFQRQLDSMPSLPGLGSLLAGLGGGAPPAAGGFTPTGLNIQLWRLAKVDCHMVRGVLGGVEEPSDKPQEGARRLGDFSGCFSTEMSDEEQKLNLNKLDAPQLDALPIASRAFGLFADKRFDFLYDKEDAHHDKVTPTDTLLSLRDWIDEDEVQASLNLTGQGEVFMRGFSDELGPYSHYSPRYRPKNARFDTLDELFMVHGVNDQWMAAYRDRLTVYPDVNSRLNINTDDPMMLYLAILSVADPTRPDPRLSNPLFVETIIRQIRTVRSFSFLGMSVQDFVSLVESMGITVDRNLKVNTANNRLLSDKSTTYRIRVTGEAGDVRKSLSAVVRLNDGLGTLVYFRED